jgi:hypothetical protein
MVPPWLFARFADVRQPPDETEELAKVFAAMCPHCPDELYGKIVLASVSHWRDLFLPKQMRGHKRLAAICHGENHRSERKNASHRVHFGKHARPDFFTARSYIQEWQATVKAFVRDYAFKKAMVNAICDWDIFASLLGTRLQGPISFPPASMEMVS